MSRKIILTSIVSIAAIIGCGGLVILQTVNADEEKTSSQVAEAAVNDTLQNATHSFSNDETVYVISNADGEAQRTYIGSTLDSNFDFDNSDLPVNLEITYKLDGQKISPEDLSGKSGHIVMDFNYSSSKKYDNKFIPFLAIGGVSLDNTKFSNIEISNGRTIQNESSTIIVGLAFAGLAEDLNVDEAILPSSFEISADVTDFSLDVTYSLATNQLFNELDTNQLSNSNDLINSVNQLADATAQILDGSSDLSAGLGQLLDKSTQLATGVNNLNAGLQTLASNNDALNGGAKAVLDVTIATAGEQINASIKNQFGEAASNLLLPTLNIDNYETELNALILKLQYISQQQSIDLTAFIGSLNQTIAQLTNYRDFYQILDANYLPKLNEYTAGVASAAAGSAQLNDNMPALVDGISTLYNGSVTLNDGILEFKTSGIDKLVSVANDDIEPFINNLRRTIEASKTYTHYKTNSATSTKFIIKTASIK